METSETSLQPDSFVFNKAFSKKESIPALDGLVTIVDIQPEKLTDPTPVLLAPGWSETLRTYKNGIERMSKLGRRSIGIEHSRHNIKGIGFSGDEIINEAQRKAESIYSVLKAKDDIEEIDAIAHSEGAVNLLMAASFDPERFRNIVLVNPAGLIGKDSFFRLAGGFSKMIGQDLITAASSLGIEGRPDLSNRGRGTYLKGFSRTTIESGKYIAKNPVRALREVRYLVQNDVSDLLSTLTEHGVNISIIASADDPVFPETKMRDLLRDHKLAQFLTIKGRHNGLNADPQIYMTEAVQMLERMRLQQEVGADTVDIVGDNLVMK